MEFNTIHWIERQNLSELDCGYNIDPIITIISFSFCSLIKFCWKERGHSPQSSLSTSHRLLVQHSPGTEKVSQSCELINNNITTWNNKKYYPIKSLLPLVDILDGHLQSWHNNIRILRWRLRCKLHCSASCGDLWEVKGLFHFVPVSNDLREKRIENPSSMGHLFQWVGMDLD